MKTLTRRSGLGVLGLFSLALALTARGAAPEPAIPAEAVKAWTARGAVLRWRGLNDKGSHLRIGDASGELREPMPVFTLPEGMNAKGLPTPSVPFGIQTSAANLRASIAELKAHATLVAVKLDRSIAKPEDFAALRDLPNLAHLDMPGVHAPGGREVLKDLTKLRALDLSDAGVSDDALRALAPLKNLQELRMTLVTVGGEGLLALPSLRLLTMDQSSFSDEGMSRAAKLPELRELFISYTPVGDAGLAHFRGHKALRVLDLQKTRVSDAGLEAVGAISNLEWLDLRICEVGDAGVARLTGLSKLAFLGLSGTETTDASLPRLAAMKGLKHLHLGGTEVSDAGLLGLAKLATLEEVDLGQTKVTPAGVQALRKALPGCKVVMENR